MTNTKMVYDKKYFVSIYYFYLLKIRFYYIKNYQNSSYRNQRHVINLTIKLLIIFRDSDPDKHVHHQFCMQH